MAMNRHRPRILGRAPRRGFSLAEVVVGAAVLSMFLLATPLAIRMATKAVPDGGSIPSASMYAGRAMELIASDTGFATSIVSNSATSIAFTVPSRDGDGQSETIQYSWSGNPGDPLLRQYNGGNATAVINGVQEFQLAYDKRAVAAPTTYSASAETLLASYDGTGGLGDDQVDQNHFVAQYFQPVLAANVASWNVTRIQILAEQAGGNDDGQALVQIQTAVAGRPGNLVLDQATMDARNLSSSYVWQTFSFSNANGISPSNGLCIVVTYLASAPSCKVQHCQDWSHAGGYVSTGNAGSTWSQSMDRDLRFYVYGTVMTPNPPVTNFQLTDVCCTLRTNTDPSSRVTTSIRVYNEPPVAGP